MYPDAVENRDGLVSLEQRFGHYHVGFLRMEPSC